jgi:alkaline phosphatase D
VRLNADPFQVGVASGEPADDGFVLWTRLVPDLQAPDYGLPPRPVNVDWEIAHDSAMRSIVGKGSTAATPELNHTIHMEVKGLLPGREYFYRFHCGDATSPVGRAKTAPAMENAPGKIRFAFASCQSYESGFYTALRDMADLDLDAVVFLGDYIYERHNSNVRFVRTHDIADVKTLEEYRHHYAQYKSDPDLKACHQAHPWIVTPDDHEVENNWAGDHGSRSDPAALVMRRTAAYRAYYENMPLRKLCLPQGSHMQLYRKVPFGKLVQFTVLDTRQFRTPQPCGDRRVVDCPGRLDPHATMMGAPQEAWFTETLAASPAQWNVICNQTVLSPMVTETPKGTIYGTDDWDGYQAARERLTRSLADTKPRNPFIIAGDIHHTYVSNVRADFAKRDSPIVASEFVVTSITSGGDGVVHTPHDDVVAAANPNSIYANHKRGYVVCEADTTKLISELRTVDKVYTPDGKVSTAATFSLISDRKGIQQES